MTLVEPELAEQVLRQALERGGDFAELYAESRHGFGLSLDDGRVERPQGGRERGACVRVVQGESTYYGHVDGLAEPDLLRVAGSVAQAVRGDARRPAGLSAAAPANGHPVSLAPEQVEAARKADLLRAVRGAGSIGRGRGHAGAAGLRRVAARGRDLQLARAARSPTTARACVSAPRSWRAAASGWRRARIPAADTPASSSWNRTPRTWRSWRRAARSPSSTPWTPLPVACRWWWATASAACSCTRLWVTGSRPMQSRRERACTPDASPRSSAPAFVTAYDDGSRAGEWGSDGVDDEGTPTQRTHDHRGRPADLLSLRPAHRPQGRRGAHGQRPARVVSPPARAAHDQHLLRPRRRRL